MSENNSLADLGKGGSDFHHSYFPMLYSIVQLENKRSFFAPMEINMEIMKKLAVNLRKEYTINYAILKDGGGSSFVCPSIELKYDQEDWAFDKLCPPNHRTYKKKKSNGKVHRGSIYKFLGSKKVSKKSRSNRISPTMVSSCYLDIKLGLQQCNSSSLVIFVLTSWRR